ncbi:twin-arginine translocase subunit TatB [Rhodobacter sp. SGA-6-6]|uniref:Sec-independent protein translocase protein TatB n=1 Tax=Rhodobacter sp. SGA-6-6 TaxID=2710882 RepID=UPI0013EC495E|nr:Sec-independent protein translocase protein TatB [Rhodobacter sp. SGA-6-6]NGM47507.1 twin-arginine translocase subunit TatB [Rhodobacter sp. SGA-6-6]
MDFSWSELLVVGIVALVVIGPKDLPGMFRELGRFTAKLRAMGREFSRAMEQAAQETGVKDVAEDLKKATSPKAMGLDAVKSAADRFEKWDPMKTKVTKPAAATAAAATAAAAAPAEAAAPAPTPAMGPATAALAEKQAARKAVAQEAAEKLRKAAAPAPEAEPAPAPAKKPGRTRKKPATPDGETA